MKMVDGKYGYERVMEYLNKNTGKVVTAKGVGEAVGMSSTSCVSLLKELVKNKKKDAVSYRIAGTKYVGYSFSTPITLKDIGKAGSQPKELTLSNTPSMNTELRVELQLIGKALKEFNGRLKKSGDVLAEMENRLQAIEMATMGKRPVRMDSANEKMKGGEKDEAGLAH